MGATGAGSYAALYPTVENNVLGTKFKIIAGYKGGAEVNLAMERGEVEGRTVGYSAVKSNKPDWLKPDGPMQALVVFGRATRHPDFPNAPTARELAKSDRDRTLIEILEAPYAMSRPYAAPPDVPPARAKALQAAFLAAHKDPAYLAEAEKLGIDVSPIGGDEILQMIEKIANMPPDLLKSVEKLIVE